MKLLLPKHNCLAELAMGHECPRDLARFGLIEDAEHVLAGQDVQLVSVFGDHDWRHLRRVSSPLRIQLLTVPSGTPMRSVISECDRPSTKASTMHRRCSSSSSLKQRFRAPASAAASIFSMMSGSSAASPSVGSSVRTSRPSFRTASKERKRTMPVSHAAPAPRSAEKAAAFCQI